MKASNSLDANLVNALLEDGRASLRSLAATLDVSVTTVSNHLAELEEEGIIDGYVPKVDYERLGYGDTAILRLKVEGVAIPEITERLRAERQLTSVYEVTGAFDIICIGKFRGADDMNDHIKALLDAPGIKSSNTSVVLNTVTEGRQFKVTVEDTM